jgi:DNA-dependent RNA polymerase auxiliary subunit epsilon
LTIFEQANFVSGSSTTKFYKPEVEDPDLREITNILQYVAADQKTREDLEKEEYYLEYVEDTFGGKDKEIEAKIRTIAEKDEIIAEKDNALAEKDKKFKDIARKFKRDGMSFEEIATLTGLSISDIEAL